MNLALQTRRAVITLSLVALAMVCVAAKTATRTDAMLSADALPSVEAVTRGAFDVSAGPVAVRVTQPTAIAVKAKVSARCDSKAIRI